MPTKRKFDVGKTVSINGERAAKGVGDHTLNEPGKNKKTGQIGKSVGFRGTLNKAT